MIELLNCVHYILKSIAKMWPRTHQFNLKQTNPTSQPAQPGESTASIHYTRWSKQAFGFFWSWVAHSMCICKKVAKISLLASHFTVTIFRLNFVSCAIFDEFIFLLRLHYSTKLHWSPRTRHTIHTPYTLAIRLKVLATKWLTRNT